jgi:hypothetical protein
MATTTMTYDEFKAAYTRAFHSAMQYTPNQVGSRTFTDRMAELADTYPAFLDQLEAEDE